MEGEIVGKTRVMLLLLMAAVVVGQQVPSLPGFQIPGSPQNPGMPVPGNPQNPGMPFPGNPQNPGTPFPGEPQNPGLPSPGEPQNPGLPFPDPGLGMPLPIIPFPGIPTPKRNCIQPCLAKCKSGKKNRFSFTLCYGSCMMKCAIHPMSESVYRCTQFCALSVPPNVLSDDIAQVSEHVNGCYKICQKGQGN